MKYLLLILALSAMVACAEKKDDESEPVAEVPVDNACLGHESLTSRVTDSTISFNNDCTGKIDRSYQDGGETKSCDVNFSFYALDNDLYFRILPDLTDYPSECYMPSGLNCEVVAFSYHREVKCSL